MRVSSCYRFRVVNFCRCDYNAEALKTETDRLARLDEIIEIEEANLTKLTSQKDTIQQELSKSESAIGLLREELGGIQETLEEKTRDVEQVKRKTAKASKALEQALKEITTKVSVNSISLDSDLTSARTMKSRSCPWNALLLIVNADWKR